MLATIEYPRPLPQEGDLLPEPDRFPPGWLTMVGEDDSDFDDFDEEDFDDEFDDDFEEELDDEYELADLEEVTDDDLADDGEGLDEFGGDFVDEDEEVEPAPEAEDQEKGKGKGKKGSKDDGVDDED